LTNWRPVRIGLDQRGEGFWRGCADADGFCIQALDDAGECSCGNDSYEAHVRAMEADCNVAVGMVIAAANERSGEELIFHTKRPRSQKPVPLWFAATGARRGRMTGQGNERA
jgi:hypothetical protein